MWNSNIQFSKKKISSVVLLGDETPLRLSLEQNSLLVKRRKYQTAYNGRHIASAPVKYGERINEIDPLATCLAAALRDKSGEATYKGVQSQDLRCRVRVQPVRKTIIFLLDASDSMLVEKQIKLAKGAVLGLLTQAYQKRYRVGVITFSHEDAKIVLPPTTSIGRARRALQAVATGGGTPLAHGLHTVLKLVRAELIRHPIDLPQIILVTDGEPSVSMAPSVDIRQEVLDIAAKFPRKHIPSIVLSTAVPGNFLRELASQLNAPLHKLTDVILR